MGGRWVPTVHDDRELHGNLAGSYENTIVDYRNTVTKVNVVE